MSFEVPEGFLLGAHTSIAGGPHTAFARAEKFGFTAMQIFTKNQNRWAARPLTVEEIEKFRAERKRTGIFAFAHAAYLPNLATPKPELLQKSIDAVAVEMERCDLLGLPYLVLHPGHHRGDTREGGISRMAESLDRIYSGGDFRVSIALENTAGQGTALGTSFAEIGEIISRSGAARGHLTLCYDTCHGWAAGYDISTDSGYRETIDKIDGEIGLDRLAAIHLNDSRNPLGSRVDRHAHIGKGEIGSGGFRRIMNDGRLAKIPKVLETPKGLETRDGSDVSMDPVNLQTLLELREER